MLTVRNYFITTIGGVLCLATGAPAEQNIGGRPGNEVGDFGEAPAGYRTEKKTASASGSSIDLGGRLAPEDQVFPWSSEILRYMPKGPKSLFATAIHKQNTNDLPGAIGDYLAAIKIDDHDPAVHWYLGTAYEAAGKATEAKQEFEKEQKMKHEAAKAPVHSYSGGYGSGTGRGYGGGDFGSTRLKFVPGEGLTKSSY